MDNINALSGLDFEKLCQVLLNKLGFRVETTKQSGDGGIDLIAYCEQPLLKGKYIVQCKRYSGGVGEPIVRDLYGVVMAERANKGILITTGHFTLSAMKFASDKNLELIDGEQLNELLISNNLKSTQSLAQKTSFSHFKCFNEEKYKFYKNMINQNVFTVEMGRDFIFSFLYNYFVDDNELKKSDVFDMLNCGFIEEYTQIFDWYIGKFYKRGKEQQELLPHYIRKYRGIAQLYNFDLFEYVQTRYAILTGKNILKVNWKEHENSYSITYNLSCLSGEKAEKILNNLWNTDCVKYYGDYRFYELMNLLSVFSYFDIDIGINHIHKLLCANAEKFEEWILTICSNYNKNCEILIPTIRPIRFATRSGTVKFDHVEIIYNDKVSLEKYFSEYSSKNKDKLKQEIIKINALFETLES